MVEIGDRFIDFDIDLEMQVSAIHKTEVVAEPTRNNFDEKIMEDTFCALKNKYTRTYKEDFVESAIESYLDDMFK